MRLTVIGPSWHHLGEPYAGGQESLVAALVDGLRDRGHHVRLYARAGTPRTLADEVELFPELPPLSDVASGDLADRTAMFDLHAYAWAVGDLMGRRDVDLVLNHSFSPLPLMLSHRLPAPVLTTLHTPPLPLMEVGAAHAAPSARYVAVSAATAAMWTTLPRVDVVPNGVDPRRFTLGPGGGDLVWVGRITPEKGLPVAIRAARLAGRRLTIIGPVSDPEHFTRDIEPLLDADVRHLGHLEQSQIHECVSVSSAALVTPRWDEPFGLVAAEAMMCGTPVVALERGGLPEVVGRWGGVVVPDPLDDEGAATALAAAIPRAEALDRARVRADALARLSSTTMIDAYCDVVDEMLETTLTRQPAPAPHAMSVPLLNPAASLLLPGAPRIGPAYTS